MTLDPVLCADGCGRLADRERPYGMDRDGDEIVELVCREHGSFDRVQHLALLQTSCVLCGHPLIQHAEASLRCQRRSARHWWSRPVQCPCDMTRPVEAR